jgi:hypothetical protein
MNAAPLAARWQAALAFSRELKEQSVEPAILVSDHMRAHDPFLALIDSGDD